MRSGGSRGGAPTRGWRSCVSASIGMGGTRRRGGCGGRGGGAVGAAAPAGPRRSGAAGQGKLQMTTLCVGCVGLASW
ncbi:hypothetical protein BU14_0177s0010 [Porphyra umbilicalis]|uniref:Uncharacterized protein n=1 Tax=Porphyra umbilicalis TaxID=2786 RepID=A0A1X6P768_PORUM|nr:hypothetical protein BU14_0177s0010 [Porphyra umbilicalis]|eukprot:OSX76729.1 hypothetical protein BU14_0177s0010 [Porphyra umbilicalis]